MESKRLVNYVIFYKGAFFIIKMLLMMTLYQILFLLLNLNFNGALDYKIVVIYVTVILFTHLVKEVIASRG